MSSFQAIISGGKTLRLTCYGSIDWVSNAADIEFPQVGEMKLDNAVTCNFRAIAFSIDRPNNMISIQMYVSLYSSDKNAHTVVITSEALKLNRYFRVGAQDKQRIWRFLSKNDVSLNSKSFQFDMEIGLAENVNERPTPPNSTGLLVLYLYEDEETTDVKLVGADGKELRAHGCVLAKASPFLRAAFYGDLKEARERRLVVPDADHTTLKLLKKFAYMGPIDAEPAALATLLPIAHRFQMPDLVRACAGLLAESLPTKELMSMLPLPLGWQETEIILLEEMMRSLGPEKIIEELK